MTYIKMCARPHLDVVAQDVARGDVHHPVALHNRLALRALARACPREY